MKEKEFLPLLSEKLGIAEINDIQKRMLASATEKRDIILLSPTGSGKTVAFILPLLKMLRPTTGRVQAVVIAPSRELVMQIAGVMRQLAPQHRVVALYGGHKVEDETNSLAVVPDIVVATPGRLLDHAKRCNVDLMPVRILVLDEFDKSLELGFEAEMKKILDRLKNLSRIILTSATRAEVLPEFLKLDNPIEINNLKENRNLRTRIRVNRVDSDGKDKLETLLTLLRNITEGDKPERTIIFVNHRESAERTAQYLRKAGVDAVLYHGALDQRERETAIALFNNGSRPILVATDLAARGLDIADVRNVIHYHQPLTPEAYTHRNGRTARVDADGDVYLLIGPEESVQDFVNIDRTTHLDTSLRPQLGSGQDTLYISAGRREKLSRGDILGFITKECAIPGAAVGKIEVYDHYALVVVSREYAREVIKLSQTKKIKGEKRKVSLVK